MVCTVCENSNVEAVNSGLILGTDLRTIARQYGVSKSAAHRHFKHCVPRLLREELESATEKSESIEPEPVAGETVTALAAPGTSLSDKLRYVLFEVERLKAVAERKGNLNAALRALDVALKGLALLTAATTTEQPLEYTVRLAFSGPAGRERQALPPARELESAEEEQPEPEEPATEERPTEEELRTEFRETRDRIRQALQGEPAKQEKMPMQDVGWKDPNPSQPEPLEDWERGDPNWDSAANEAADDEKRGDSWLRIGGERATEW